MLSLFPRGVLDEILNLIESVSEGFPSYSCLPFWRSGVVGLNGGDGRGGQGGNFNNCLFVSWPTKPLNNGVNPFRKELAPVERYYQK